MPPPAAIPPPPGTLRRPHARVRHRLQRHPIVAQRPAAYSESRLAPGLPSASSGSRRPDRRSPHPTQSGCAVQHRGSTNTWLGRGGRTGWCQLQRTQRRSFHASPRGPWCAGRGRGGRYPSWTGTWLGRGGRPGSGERLPPGVDRFMQVRDCAGQTRTGCAALPPGLTASWDGWGARLGSGRRLPPGLDSGVQVRVASPKLEPGQQGASKVG